MARTPPSAISSRVDRHLAAALVEIDTPHFSVSTDQLTSANESFVLRRDKGEEGNVLIGFSILDVLVYEQRALKEEDLIRYTMEHFHVPPVNLAFMDFNEELLKGITREQCVDTRSLPFDKDGEQERTYWEGVFGRGIVWHSTTLENLREAWVRAAFAKPVAKSLLPAPAVT